jgi:hypothetical protein
MLTKKLFALALVSALGLSVSAAQAQGFDHRDRGFHHTARHGEFRHGHQARHHSHHNRFNNRGHR